jgi:RNA polymerase sigma-70 factor (ECF subfamily)
LEERDLVAGLKEGNEECFIRVVDLYKKKVISLCYSYTRDYQEAEDLSQEVFITIYNSIHGFRGDCSLSTYIYKIGVSRCLDFKRKKSIKNFLTGLINVQKDESIDVDDKNYIRQCVMSLPEELKTAVVLYYYVGLSQKEIGEVLNISQKNVEGKIYRAKQKLRVELEKGGYLACSKNGMI